MAELPDKDDLALIRIERELITLNRNFRRFRRWLWWDIAIGVLAVPFVALFICLLLVLFPAIAALIGRIITDVMHGLRASLIYLA